MLEAGASTHLSVVGTDYDEDAERRRAIEVFVSRGTRLSELPQHLGTWRPWQRRPPWVWGWGGSDPWGGWLPSGGPGQRMWPGVALSRATRPCIGTPSTSRIDP